MEKKSVGLLELETADLECFLEKTTLGPLGVKFVFRNMCNDIHACSPNCKACTLN
jgi:hypothetical protein